MPKRTPLIVANWKMNKTAREAGAVARELKGLLKGTRGVDVLLAPPCTSLHAVKGFPLAAQNCHWEDDGAFTGEISAVFLREAGCEYAILGHSERRRYSAESDALINAKLKAAYRSGLKPILCIGELLEERERNQTFSVLERQVDEALAGVTAAQMKKTVLAYEPVWAIGTGRSASTEQAVEVHRFLRERLSKMYNEGVSESTRILYGGSVTPDNTEGLLVRPDIDGALVGGASLKAGTFAAIVQAALRGYKLRKKNSRS
jgi:triosephosphate isomerase (TIM)